MNKTIYPVIADNDALPLTLAGIGVTDGLSAVSCKKGIPAHQIIITVGGEGSVSVCGKAFAQKRGSVAVIPSGMQYSLAPEGVDWSVAWLNIGGSLSLQLLDSVGLGEPMSETGLDTEEMLNLHSQLTEYAEKTMPDPRIASTLLYSFILSVREAIESRDAEKYNCSITESVRYIDMHYGENITLDRLAAISGVSLQHFCRVFRSKLGMRPMEYLARTRVAKAKILLGETADKIGDIASAVGFEDSNYFGITFKKYEGQSPSEYRKERGISEKG